MHGHIPPLNSHSSGTHTEEPGRRRAGTAGLTQRAQAPCAQHGASGVPPATGTRWQPQTGWWAQAPVCTAWGSGSPGNGSHLKITAHVIIIRRQLDHLTSHYISPVQFGWADQTRPDQTGLGHIRLVQSNLERPPQFTPEKLTSASVWSDFISMQFSSDWNDFVVLETPIIMLCTELWRNLLSVFNFEIAQCWPNHRQKPNRDNIQAQEN